MGATIAEIIATLKENYTVTTIVVSHDRDLALTISDRVAILHEGRILAIEPPAALRQTTNPVIQDFLNPQIDIQHPRFRKLEANHE